MIDRIEARVGSVEGVEEGQQVRSAEDAGERALKE
jgi:hypothetical protein